MEGIEYPTKKHKIYLDTIYKYCNDHNYSLILKGSLAKGTATNFSDIDLIVLGDISDENVDELVTLYDKPVMTNFTVNPKGILVLVYPDYLSVDLDIRDTICSEDLIDSKVLLRNDENIIIHNGVAERKKFSSKYFPERSSWYSVFRLMHRALLKYLSGKTDSAHVLLSEINEELPVIGITDLKMNGIFKEDIHSVFNEMCTRFDIDTGIEILFRNLIRELN